MLANTWGVALYLLKNYTGSLPLTNVQFDVSFCVKPRNIKDIYFKIHVILFTGMLPATLERNNKLERFDLTVFLFFGVP